MGAGVTDPQYDFFILQGVARHGGGGLLILGRSCVTSPSIGIVVLAMCSGDRAMLLPDPTTTSMPPRSIALVPRSHAN